MNPDPLVMVCQLDGTVYLPRRSALEELAETLREFHIANEELARLIGEVLP